MSLVYFITHPEVIIDPKIKVDDWKLSEIGISRINKLSKFNFWHDVTKIYSSPEKKAKEGAEILSNKLSIYLEIVENLKEIDRSATGYLPKEKYINAIKEFYKNPQESVQGWENALKAQERISNTINNLDSNKDIAVISHGTVGSLYLSFLNDKPPLYSNDPKNQGRYFIADITNRKSITDWIDY